MRRTLAAMAILLGLGATSALAHHPFDAEFDWKKPVTVTGTVTKFEWRDPHAMIEVKGRDDNGAEAQWMVELGNTAQLQRAGWRRTQFKAGEQITIDGWMAKDGSKKVSAKSVTTAGREMFAAGSFFDMARPPAGRREAAATTGTATTTTDSTKRR